MSDEIKPTDAAEQTAAVEDGASEVDLAEVKARIFAALKTVYDPEIPVDIYELGLIYEVELSERGIAAVKMTLTSPACPVAGTLPGEVESKVRSVDGVRDCAVELVWDPPWDKEMMSEAAKVTLGFF